MASSENNDLPEYPRILDLARVVPPWTSAEELASVLVDMGADTDCYVHPRPVSFINYATRRMWIGAIMDACDRDLYEDFFMASDQTVRLAMFNVPCGLWTGEATAARLPWTTWGVAVIRKARGGHAMLMYDTNHVEPGAAVNGLSTDDLDPGQRIMLRFILTRLSLSPWNSSTRPPEVWRTQGLLVRRTGWHLSAVLSWIHRMAAAGDVPLREGDERLQGMAPVVRGRV